MIGVLRQIQEPLEDACCSAAVSEVKNLISKDKFVHICESQKKMSNKYWSIKTLLRYVFTVFDPP